MIPDIAVLSEAGGRQTNQDCGGYTVRGPRACCVLADGLGAYGGGDVASQLAVDCILEDFDAAPDLSPASLKAALQRANSIVLSGQNGDAARRGMRTTVAALWMEQSRAIWGHAGDTRLYLFRDGRVRTQTKDHSVPQALVTAGQLAPDQIRFHEDRARLLKSLGTLGALAPTIEPEPFPVLPGDAFLLATDGFWELIDEKEMEQELASAQGAQAWLLGMARLVRSRISADADNYSAIAVMVQGGEQ